MRSLDLKLKEKLYTNELKFNIKFLLCPTQYWTKKLGSANLD